MSELRKCGRCGHTEDDLGPRGVCIATVTPEYLGIPRPCGCPAFVTGEPKQGVCRSCHCGITWWLTRLGNLAPYDADGTPHFATCPNAARHRKPRAAAGAAR